MTITAAPSGADLASGFTDLGAYLKANPAIRQRIPAPRIVNIPLKGTTTGERLTELADIAREMGTAVVPHDGIFTVSAGFDGVTLEAHHNPVSFLIVQDSRRKAEAAA